MIKLTVQDMTCGHCVKSIKEALSLLDSNVEVNADLDAGTLEISSNMTTDAILAAIEEAGFPAQLA